MKKADTLKKKMELENSNFKEKFEGFICTQWVVYRKRK